MRGFLDRLDLAPTGELRVVDYKTGHSPSPDFEARALYQLKFYALMIYRLRGIVPAQLKLIYLADGMSLQYAPSETELLSFENGVAALWRAISSALDTGDFPPRPSGMCTYCAHQSLCPEFGGTPPPYPGAPGREPRCDISRSKRSHEVPDACRRRAPSESTGPDVRGQDGLGAELEKRVHHRVRLVAAHHRPDGAPGLVGHRRHRR